MKLSPLPWLRGRLLVLVAGGVALLLAGTLAVALSRDVGSERLDEAAAGFELAAIFTLPTFDGGTFTLSDHADGPVFAYFWASWCAPCFSEAPLVQRLWPEYGAADYTFVGVNILDREDDARAFIEGFGLTFPTVAGENGSVYLDYGVVGLPEGFFLRPGRRLNQKFIGELTEDPFRDMLDDLGAGA